MSKLVKQLLDSVRPNFEKGGSLHWAFPLFEFPDTFFLTPDHKTHSGAHVRDPADLKRLMMFVIFALVPATLFGMYNVGYQGALAQGNLNPDFLSCFLTGAHFMLPVIAVSYAVGGAAEMLFCVVRKHEVAEGFLVTGLLFPLTLPPTIPLWMVAVGVVFGVVIGKEVFGGTGMNILNPALTARAFIFFTYPAAISGAEVWDVSKTAPMFGAAGAAVDGYTGATPLLTVANAPAGAKAVEVLANYQIGTGVPANWDFGTLAMGLIPGSMGEVSAVAALLGALLLVVTGIGSWRIMAGCVVGLVGVTALFNGLAGPESNAMMTLPPHFHLVMGGFAFGTVFMATDPVSAAITDTGRWIYGIGIGVLCGLVRVVNPAYPEGMMLAVLFMNVFAPLIDYFVVQQSTRRRLARMATV